MKRTQQHVGVLLLMALLPFGFSQVNDSGVDAATDEFTGIKTCFQNVHTSPQDLTGISLTSDSALDDTYILITRHLDSANDAVFNMSGVMSGDLVYIRFPSSGEVIDFAPYFVFVDDVIVYEMAGLWVTREFLETLLSSTEDIRIRFSGENGNADFTIMQEILEALAAGIGETCL